jgi:Tfp pilus assembly protein PilF
MGPPESNPTAPAAGWLRRGLLSPWPAVVLGLLCFLTCVGNDFAYDDVPLIVDNPRIRNAADFRSIWLSDWWYPLEGTTHANPKRDRLYRPLTLQSFALDYAAHGRNPRGYHLANVGLHAAVCLLAWHFARRMTGDAAVASLAAILFAVHPVHVEAVSNVVGRAEVLAALFLLGGLLALTTRRAESALRPTLGAALLLLLALLAKETAICYPAVAWLVLYWTQRRQPHPWRWWLTRLALLLLPLAAYLPLRYVALEHQLFRVQPADVWMNPLVTATVVERVLGVFTIQGHYTRLLLMPSDLSFDYGLAIVDPRAGFIPLTAVGLAATVALLSGLLGFRSRDEWRREVAVWGAITLASYVLISNAVLLIGVSLAERLMYWPSVPVLILTALGIVHFWRRYCLPGQPLAKIARLVYVLGVLLVGAFGLRTAIRNLDWADNLTLTSRDVETYPQGIHLNRGYATELIHFAQRVRDPNLRQQTLAEAEKHLEAALALDPANAEALAMRAGIRADLGDIDRAYRYAESALLLEPSLPDALRVLARLRGGSGNEERRIANLRAAAESQPTDPTAWLALASAELDTGQPYAAREPLERAAALAPNDVVIARRLGETLALLGENDAALAQFRRVLVLAPDDWATHTNLSTVLAEKDPQAALVHAQRAYELRPQDVRTTVNLAEVYVRLKKTRAALALYRRLVESELEKDDPFRLVVEKRIEVLERREK